MSHLLFEIGTEELPAGFINPALKQLREKFAERAKELQISYGDIATMATPRRLALIIYDLADKQDDIREEIIGPSVKAGLDQEGKPSKAALGFAKSKGASPDELSVVATEKGEYLMLVREVQGRKVQELLPEILHKLLLDLTFAKSMRWGGNKHTFARPIQWLLALHGRSVVEFEHEGIRSSNTSMGHRFLSNHKIVIEDATTYEKQLAEVHIIVDQEKRKDAVVRTINDAVAAAPSLSHGKIFIDENLLATVTNLVELPCGICGSFDDKFLSLPDDVLITSMREHQKYFPIVDQQGSLLAGFVAVNNTKMADESLTRKGHQRVLRARLEDALFFFNSDKERKLDVLLPGLDGIVFQAKLGTMAEKSARIVKLTSMLGDKVAPAAKENACRAAQLCKVDLLTDMVGEFPSLQGVMGEAYANLSGEKPEVALALREHYMPKRAGADLPGSAEGVLVGLADRIDTLAGCFGIGQIPTGTADPFGLRRISLAILHLIQKRDYSLSLREVFHKSLALYGDRVDGGSSTVNEILSFIEKRYINDQVTRGRDSEALAAAVAVDFDDVNDCTLRVEALSNLKSNPSFAVLASAYKRIRNIIKENKETEVREELLIEDGEKTLYHLLMEVREQMTPLLSVKNYQEALENLLKMKEPVDRFFDEVMVMADDQAVRRNRLNLLTALGELVLEIGDISKMQ